MSLSIEIQTFFVLPCDTAGLYNHPPGIPLHLHAYHVETFTELVVVATAL